ncbi:VanW family protein [Thermincola potens]|uniref:VanW family protein n=1 Tax=Thermincola potens (strain JR) TaxID=635013 RepID=D5X827_THEPJ|nr:VanW family protein [Thermincola potens]ADG82747.1 VanW family protein [Thermincola potens JR]
MSLSTLKVFLLAIIVVAISAVLSFFVAIAVSAQEDQIYSGVWVEDISLGMLTREQARNKLEELNDQIRGKEVQVKYPGGEAAFKLAEIDASIDVEGILKKAWEYGRKGSLLDQWQERRRIAREGVIIPLKINYSRTKFEKLAQKLGAGATIEPQDAKLVITRQDTIQIIPGKQGKVIDTQNALAQIEDILNEKQEPVLNLVLKTKEPEMTTQEVENMHVNGIISHFSTFFNVQKTNRVYNIKVAAGALDGTFIKPGETFSFNKVVGPRSKEAGYKLAPTILNNEFIDSLGGGVCQASTTLYNAVLLAGLPIIERANHSLVVSYVPLGQDAAVAYGGKDFKFKNNLSSWVVLKTEVVGNRLTVKIFGDTALKKDVRITNQILKTYPFKVVYKQDATMYKGKQVIKQKGVNGYKVASQRHIYVNGKEVRTEKLPSSYYKPLDQIILVGTKKVAAKTKTSISTNTNNPKKPVAGQGTLSPGQPPAAPPANAPQPEAPQGNQNNTGVVNPAG